MIAVDVDFEAYREFEVYLVDGPLNSDHDDEHRILEHRVDGLEGKLSFKQAYGSC